MLEKHSNFSYDNVPGLSNTRAYTSNIEQRNFDEEVNMHTYNGTRTTNANKRRFDDANLCICCPVHKNYDEKFRRVFKKLFLLREITRECCEDVKLTLLTKNNADTDENEFTFLNTFNFSLQTVEDLDEVEQYLQQPNHFQSIIKELLKMGGTIPYDFVK